MLDGGDADGGDADGVGGLGTAAGVGDDVGRRCRDKCQRTWKLICERAFSRVHLLLCLVGRLIWCPPFRSVVTKFLPGIGDRISVAPTF